jgi:HAE1 family hydrophobic/amphiphilic exporter-1
MIAVPVSLLGTFAFFPFLGFSINTLSLFGLVLAIGLVVDDAIVVVEAVEHHIEQGMKPREATLQAMKEVGGPVVGIALVLSSVFIPVAFLGGIQGRLNKQFAVTIAISVLISAFNALSLSPALCALILKPREKMEGWAAPYFHGFNRWFHKTTDGYVNLSGRFIRKAAIALVVLAGRALPMKPSTMKKPARTTRTVSWARPCPPASCPTRTTAISSSTSSCRPRPASSVRTRWAARSRRSSSRPRACATP